MKRFTVLAVPVVIALLTFGITVKAMAAVEDSAAANKGGNAAADESIAVKDTLNDNNVAAANAVAIKTGDIDTDVKTTDIDIDKKDIDSHNNGDAEVEHGAYNAVANNGSIAKVDDSTNIKVGDVLVAVNTNELDSVLAHNEIELGAHEIEKGVMNTGNNSIRGGEVNGVNQVTQISGNQSQVNNSVSVQAFVK
jgi:hypothetical protein